MPQGTPCAGRGEHGQRMARKYKAFISYSWTDKVWAAWLHRALELYTTPRALVGKDTPLGPVPARLHPIFRDRDEEAAGRGIGAAVEAAMADSDFLVVLCSPRSAKSQWVNREVAWFKRHRSPDRILCVIVDGEPGASFMPGREAEECFPAAILYEVDEALAPTPVREEAPLAADARPTGDGKRGAKLKVAAAMLGVGLDDLVRRDARRQAIRRRIVTTLAVSVATVMTGLAWSANAARNDAVAAREEAVFQRDEAQALVEFMLTDLRSRLEAVGRLDVLDVVGQRLSDSYARQDLASLDADALGRQARVQLLLGEIDNKRGDLGAALVRYTEAAATTEEQLRRAPGSAQQIFDHAQSVFYVGYIAWQRGDLAAAEVAFRHYHDLAMQLVAIDPSNDDWQSEMEYALSNLGTLALQQGQGSIAEEYFTQARDVSHALLSRHPDDVDRILAAGQSLAWLSDAHFHQIELDEARIARGAERNLYEGALALSGEHAGLQLRLVATDTRLANVALAQGAPEAGRQLAERAAASAERLRRLDPTDTERLDFWVRSQIRLAEALIALGNLSEARAVLTRSENAAHQLLAIDPAISTWLTTLLSETRILIGNLDAAAGESQSADATFRELELLLQPIVEKAPVVTGVVHRYCSAIAGQARMRGFAPALWFKIVDTLGAAPERHGPEARTLLAEAYVHLGRADEARQITLPLAEAGYRRHDFLALLSAFPQLAPGAD